MRRNRVAKACLAGRGGNASPGPRRRAWGRRTARRSVTARNALALTRIQAMWQERAWARHQDREMTFQVRTKSRDWMGFEATIYDASAGFSEQQFVRHNVSMQLGRPLLVTSHCDGKSLRRLQIPGDMKIVPPGVPRVWETESATVKLSMYLGPALIRSAAEAMGVDADRVAV